MSDNELIEILAEWAHQSRFLRPYSKLSEDEKEFYREIAREILAVLGRHGYSLIRAYDGPSDSGGWSSVDVFQEIEDAAVEMISEVKDED